jgi:hypothetical protein
MVRYRGKKIKGKFSGKLFKNKNTCYPTSITTQDITSAAWFRIRLRLFYIQPSGLFQNKLKTDISLHQMKDILLTHLRVSRNDLRKVEKKSPDKVRAPAV